MAKTTVALFDDVDSAEQTVKELVGAGFSRDDMSVVAHRAKCGPSLGPVEGIGTDTTTTTGAVIGGIAGLTAGVVALAIPGIGPLLAAGPLIAGPAAGAAVGALAAKLTDLGVPEEDAGCYCEALRRGGVLLVLPSDDEKAERAAEIIGRHRIVDLQECVDDWKATGWKKFDPDSPVPKQDRPLALPFDPKRRERRSVRQYYFRVR